MEVSESELTRRSGLKRREWAGKYLGPDAGHGRGEDAFEDEEAEVNLGSSPVGESTCCIGE